MTVRVLEGHVLDVLRSLPSNTFQCVATSPPYYGLRDYGLPPLVWGDGWLGSLGLEPEPSLYVEHLVSVFREVRRVLRPDGCIFVNLGDSYAGSGKGPPGVDGFQSQASNVAPAHRGVMAGRAISGQQRHVVAQASYKPKDLLGMPWMVAFALRADGWYLRAEVIWSKPNPMPESVTDRPTKAHETVFLLAKSRTYFYDADAIREEHTLTSWTAQSDAAGLNHSAVREHARFAQKLYNPAGRNKRSVWEIATAPFPNAHFATFPPKLVEPMLLAGSRPGDHVLDPFGGAGTTGLVADRLGRDCTLIELNPAYAQMARDRITGDSPLFAEVVA